MKRKWTREKIKIAAFDLDGTLLNSGLMSERVAEALKALRASGVATAVSTGRGFPQLESEIAELFDYLVMINGAVIRSGEETLFSSELEKGAILRVIDEVRSHNGFLVLFLPDEMHITSGAETHLLKYVYENGVPEFSHNMFFESDIRAFAENVKRPVHKFQVFFLNHRDLEETVDALNGCSGISVVEMPENNLEITADGISKSSGLGILASHLGCTMENVAAFGDAENDVAMLKDAGFAVVMGNGDEYTKSFADYITGSVEEDGAAEAIYRLFGITERR